jgi:type I restriction enzyme S subunit
MEVRPGYKQTEVGVIPDEWGTSALLAVADCLDNLRVPLNDAQRQRMQGDIPYCGANGVLDYVNDFVVDDDIILMAEDGGYFDEYASRPIAYRMQGKCWVNNHAHILKAKRGHDQGFLFYSLVHKNILPFLASGTRAKLNKSEMEKIVVPAPPSETEQRAIAAALSDVDALLGGLDRLIAKKRDLKQAAMQQLLTGQTRLPGFSGEWEVKRLGNVAEIVMGQSPSSSNYNSRGAGLPLIQGNADVANRQTIKRVFTTQITKRGRSGDILMSVRAPVGEVSRAIFDVCLGRGVCALRFPNDFLYHLLIFLEPTWAKHSKGSTFDSVNSNDVKSVEVKLALDPNEQTAIAAVLSDMDAELAALEARRNKTRDLKQAMMQELLTGKTRVKPELAHA